jgi:hypothetical protein
MTELQIAYTNAIATGSRHLDALHIVGHQFGLTADDVRRALQRAGTKVPSRNR